MAFSGFHVAFSRVALTDASFLLCWILGLVCGQRFLERPRLSSGIALGLSVGLAQWFKYSGWLLGGFVVVAACLGILVDPKERHRPRIRAVWGFGLLAVLLAVAVYWPWFAFVESHGGYAGLLKHHQSYMGGFSSWPPHLRLQLEQMAALSGGPAWNVTEYLAAVLCCELVLLPLGKPNRYRASLLLAIFALVFPFFYWWLGAGWVLDPRQRRSPGRRLLAAAWLGLSILTPLYHPYARLWLPLHFLGWIMTANLINQGFPTPRPKPGKSASALETGNLHGINLWEWIACGIAMLAIEPPGPRHVSLADLGSRRIAGPLAPSDLLRNGVRNAVADLPAGTPGLRLLVRPPVTFYVGGRVPVRVEPDPARLLAPATPGSGPWWTWPSCVRGGPQDSARGAPWPLGARPRIPDTVEPSGPAGYRPGCCPGRQVEALAPALAASSQNRRTRVMNQNPQPPVSLWPDRRALGPITDLYQLTMMAGYLAAGMAGKRATFELFVRRMPPHRRLPRLRRARTGDR